MIVWDQLCDENKLYLLAASCLSSEKLLDFGIASLFLKCMLVDISLLDYSVLRLIAAIIPGSLDQSLIC